LDALDDRTRAGRQGPADPAGTLSQMFMTNTTSAALRAFWQPRALV